jgi:hypothetical protein
MLSGAAPSGSGAEQVCAASPPTAKLLQAGAPAEGRRAMFVCTRRHGRQREPEETPDGQMSIRTGREALGTGRSERAGHPGTVKGDSFLHAPPHPLSRSCIRKPSLHSPLHRQPPRPDIVGAARIVAQPGASELVGAVLAWELLQRHPAPVDLDDVHGGRSLPPLPLALRVLCLEGLL